MSPFKHSFQFQWTRKKPVQPAEASDLNSTGILSNGSSHSDPRRVRLSYPEGDFRLSAGPNIKEMRGSMMLDQLHNEQTRRMWATWEPGQGVVLNLGGGTYDACPPLLKAESGGLFDQIVTMNIRV